MKLKNQLQKNYEGLINDDSLEFELMESKSFIFEYMYYSLLEDCNGYFLKRYGKNRTNESLWAKAETIITIFLGYKG